MKMEDYEYENPRELEEILYKMNTEDFLETELTEQLNEEIFSDNKTNYIESYMSKYKFYKNEYEANDDFTERLKNNKDNLIESVIEQICDKFCLEVDEEDRNTKLARVIYEFFVIDYRENLKSLFMNYINNNKKSIISVLKKEKKRRDISMVASKLKFANSNDALIIGNVSFIINEILNNEQIENFIDLIISDDDSVVNLKIKEYVDSEKIAITEDTYNAFVAPYFDEELGWSDIISEIEIEMCQNAAQVDLDILK